MIAVLVSGDPCTAARDAEKLGRKLTRLSEKSAAKLEAMQARSARSVLEVADGQDADLREDQSRILAARTADALLDRAVAGAAGDGRTIAQLCSAVSEEETRASGRVVRIDDSKRLLELDSGLLLLLGNGRQRGPLMQGVDVNVRYHGTGSGTGILDRIETAGAVAKPGALQLQCLALRIAPFQGLPPFHSGPFVLHDPRGYSVDFSEGKYPEKLVLERGSAVAVEDLGCGGMNPDGSMTRYTAELRVAGTNFVIAPDLTGDDEPVILPPELPLFFQLEMTVRRHTCLPTVFGQPPACSVPDLVRTEKHEVSFYDRGDLCYRVEYASLTPPQEVSPSGFAADQVVDLAVLNMNGVDLGPNTSPDLQFEAEGYSVSGGVSSYPMVTTIGLSEDFAVHSLAQDFYQPDALFQFALTGVETPSALRFPRVTGERHGLPFWYWCPLPRIARDMLHECPEEPNSFYKLPFEGGAPTWTMGQGNFGTFTHKGGSAYAFDFGAPANEPILAARGGRVLVVDDSNSGNCYCGKPTCDPAKCGVCDPPNSGNGVAIVHQDGTVAQYFHFPLNGVSVAANDVVERGDSIGVVGNTGCSSDPHLHFEVLKGIGDNTMQIRFESDVAGNEECYIPDEGDPIESTNAPNP